MTSKVIVKGTFTPADGSGAGLTLTVNGTPWFKRLASLMLARFSVTYPTTADGSNAKLTLGNLPATVQASGNDGAVVTYSTKGAQVYALVENSSSNVGLYDTSGVALTNANMSGKRVDVLAVYNLG